MNWIKQTDTYSNLIEEIGNPEDTDTKSWQKSAYTSKLFSDFVTKYIQAGEVASSEIGNMYTGSIFMSFLSYLSIQYNSENNITAQHIGFISYGSGSKSKVFEGTIQPNWRRKIKDVKLFEYLESRMPIDVDTYEKIHTSNFDKPILEGSKIELDFVEKQETNYGLRRYRVKK